MTAPELIATTALAALFVGVAAIKIMIARLSYLSHCDRRATTPHSRKSQRPPRIDLYDDHHQQ